MKSTLLMVVSSLLAAALLVAAQPQDDTAPQTRIGTYDSRSIAIAYSASEFNPVRAKMAEMQEAKAAGDERRMRELDEWGRNHQVQLHFQGFGEVKVADLLDHVKQHLPAVAARNQLIAIVDRCDFTAENVQIVDVTEELVKLYEPSERTLKQALEVRRHERVPLHTIAQMDPLD